MFSSSFFHRAVFSFLSSSTPLLPCTAGTNERSKAADNGGVDQRPRLDTAYEPSEVRYRLLRKH